MPKTLPGIVHEGKVSFLEPVNVPDGTRALITLLTDGEKPSAGQAGFWLPASESALDAVWDNAEDDVYAELLEE